MPRLLMRILYTLVMYLLTPVILYRLAIRGLRAPAYFARWRERFGFFPAPPMENSIWVHAVSVGEFNAAIPLVRALMKRFPESPFVITTVTPTGSDRVVQVFGDEVFHVYLPYDLPAAVRRFLRRVRPALGVVMETEIWPNLFYACASRDIPIVVANARLSEQSLRGYRPVKSLAAMALNCASSVAAQTQTDADRLMALGGRPELIQIAGSLKFDQELSPQLRSAGEQLRDHWGSDRFVWVAASTHEDDEGPVLEAFQELLRHDSEALLILVPRHPERFSRAVSRCRSLGLATSQRTVEELPTREIQCFVADTMGELMMFFAACDVAFVGGSLAPIGGHNVLEPAALAKPVLVGPNTFNFADINEMLVRAGGSIIVQSTPELEQAIVHLAAHREQRLAMGQAAYELVERKRGALGRIMALVEVAIADQPALGKAGST